MPKLTDTQLVILSAGAKRKDGAVLPPPRSLKAKGGALSGTLKSLLKKGLIQERPAKGAAPTWREAEDGSRLSLVITEAGLHAIGVATGRPAGPAGVEAPRRCGATHRRRPPAQAHRHPARAPLRRRPSGRRRGPAPAQVAQGQGRRLDQHPE